MTVQVFAPQISVILRKNIDRANVAGLGTAHVANYSAAASVAAAPTVGSL